MSPMLVPIAIAFKISLCVNQSLIYRPDKLLTPADLSKTKPNLLFVEQEVKYLIVSLILNADLLNSRISLFTTDA